MTHTHTHTHTHTESNSVSKTISVSTSKDSSSDHPNTHLSVPFIETVVDDSVWLKRCWRALDDHMLIYNSMNLHTVLRRISALLRSSVNQSDEQCGQTNHPQASHETRQSTSGTILKPLIIIIRIALTPYHLSAQPSPTGVCQHITYENEVHLIVLNVHLQCTLNLKSIFLS